MAVDTPARIAVLGAGPIGIETALYARYLGYDVDVYERDSVAAHVLRWGHVSMFSPFGMNRSSLGLAALQAQDEAYRPPADDEILTGRQWAERYLLPLAQSDLLADHLRPGCEVLGVSRRGLLKGDLPGGHDRDASDFVLLVRQDGRERYEAADVVIDTTGVLGQPNHLGPGGLPAVGETALRDEIDRICPDVLGAERDRFAGQRVLVVGGAYSAATTVVNLARLANEAANTRVTWATRGAEAGGQRGPIARIDGDRLPARDALAAEANNLAASETGPVEWLAETVVEAIEPADGGGCRVRFVGRHAGERRFDRIVGHTGYRPDNRLYAELQVHECYASQGPMKLAAALLGGASGDCLEAATFGSQSLLTPEPNFYLLGAKSYGRRSDFLFATGLQQIRELFTMIGDRETLDLYASVRNLLA